MKKACFIVPYFGQFKNYFQLFLNSCKKNPDFDWLFITDSDFNYDVPDNVRVVKSTFNQVKERVQSKFTFKVNLSSPYKLCDLKPMYGYIFEDYLVDYPFWGYCDVDVIWGRISDFVADQEFDKFDKIGDLGHCTFVRNSKSVNRLFMSKLNGTERYKQVLEDDQNESFDEEYDKSINNIFAEEGLSILPLRQMANIYTKSSYFRITSLGDNHKYSVGPVIKGFFEWDDGRLLEWYSDHDGPQCKEYMYIHMQSRDMKNDISGHNERFKIIPNSFENLEFDKVTSKNFDKIKSRHFNLHYFKLRSYNLFDKTMRALNKHYRDR